MKAIQLGLSEVGRLLLPIAILFLLGAVGLGWLVKSLFILLGFLILAPIVGLIGFQWWLRRNLFQAACPVCQVELMSLNRSEFQCPSCGEPLKAESGHLVRLTPPGTIDVNAVEVTAQSVDD